MTLNPILVILIVFKYFFVMPIKAMSADEFNEYIKKFPLMGGGRSKYPWDALTEVGSGFTIKRSEMPSVNYNGPTSPDYLRNQGVRISCLKTGDPEEPLAVIRVK